MSLPRLPFLYPTLFPRRILLPATAATRRHRHGTAVEPPPATDEPAPSSPDAGGTPPSPPASSDHKFSPLEAIIGGTSTPPTAEPKPASPPPPPPPADKNPPLQLAPGEWVHHFDTYSLAKSLEGSEFQRGQSVTIMKGIRGLLTQNLDVAKESLVSKSDVENESYLFHAACAELRTEIYQTRKAHLDALRDANAAIQQEYDLLNHKFIESIMSLKDELNGLFNDRKMVTRAEQRAMENKIQELNYKITVLIGSELRSEIEKLRWTTTRRGLIAIAALALFVISSIRMSKGKKKKEAPPPPPLEKEDDTHGDNVLKGGEGVGFISLG